VDKVISKVVTSSLDGGDSDSPPMQGDKLLAERQAETRPLTFLQLIGTNLHKVPEQFLLMLLRYARA